MIRAYEGFPNLFKFPAYLVEGEQGILVTSMLSLIKKVKRRLTVGKNGSL